MGLESEIYKGEEISNNENTLNKLSSEINSKLGFTEELANLENKFKSKKENTIILTSVLPGLIKGGTIDAKTAFEFTEKAYCGEEKFCNGVSECLYNFIGECRERNLLA